MKALMKIVAEMQNEGFPGVVTRGTPGKPWLQTTWRTTYLHTNGAFRERMPALEKKLRNAIAEIDSQGWKMIPVMFTFTMPMR